jgi:hypothetical protein
VLGATEAWAICEDKLGNKQAYKKCLNYFYMAGTPRQREAAELQKMKERQVCERHPTLGIVCPERKTKAQREREEAIRRSRYRDEPLRPIYVTPAPTPVRPPPRPPCPPGQILTRGVCLAANPCPPGQVLNRAGVCRR